MDRNVEKLNVDNELSNESVILYRAVSIDEFVDIIFNGFRTKIGGYETVKLFALSYNDAWTFGLNNQIAYDSLPFIIIQTSIPIDVYNQSDLFPADGMEAIAIEDKYLNLLKLII